MACLMMLIPLWGCSSLKEGEHAKGETVQVGEVKSTLKDVAEIQGTGKEQPASGKVFLQCELSLENTTDKDLLVSSMMSFTCYVDGEKQDISFSALSSRGEKNQMDGTIKAGETFDGVLGYEVPKGWKEVKIEYQPDLTKSDKVTYVYRK